MTTSTAVRPSLSPVPGSKAMVIPDRDIRVVDRLFPHLTWSINSICHMIGDRPFASRDKVANVWPLALLSMGESWHNSHHADPTCARHGVLRGQIDISARVIWLLEKLGWTNPARLTRITATTDRTTPPGIPNDAQHEEKTP